MSNECLSVRVPGAGKQAKAAYRPPCICTPQTPSPACVVVMGAYSKPPLSALHVLAQAGVNVWLLPRLLLLRLLSGWRCEVATMTRPRWMATYMGGCARGVGVRVGLVSTTKNAGRKRAAASMLMLMNAAAKGLVPCPTQCATCEDLRYMCVARRSIAMLACLAPLGIAGHWGMAFFASF
jgi:hypothetical protein